MSKVSAIDLGSNSFRILIYDCISCEVIGEYNEVVGMADGLRTGLISKKAQNKVIETIRKSVKKLNYKPSEAICVTTATMRLAKNSNEVLKNFEKNTDAKFKIISAKKEARLTLLAVKYALNREEIISPNFILLDIGRGSTEIIVNTHNSFNFGIVALTQKHFKKGLRKGA